MLNAKTFTAVCAAAATMASALTVRAAEPFPNKPVTVIFAFSPGTPVETAFRPVAAEASKALGQPVIIENRSGANSRLGINAVRNAQRDPHILTMAFDAVTVLQPLVDPNFQIEAGRDYTPIAFFMEFPMVFVGSASAPFRDLKTLVAYAKANPGALNIAALAGGSGHFLAERFRQAAGIEATIVPYKGSPQALVDLVAGRVHLQFATAVATRSFIDSGKLIGIATTGAQRYAPLPTLATLSESGVPVISTAWYGLVGPAGIPPSAISRLHEAFHSVLTNPEVKRRLEADGTTVATHATPQTFTDFIRSEFQVWSPILKNSGIRIE